jgi:hypothetical protein
MSEQIALVAKALAYALKENAGNRDAVNALNMAAEQIAWNLEREYPRFDRPAFLDACGVKW